MNQSDTKEPRRFTKRVPETAIIDHSRQDWSVLPASLETVAEPIECGPGSG